jgi:hypothetical protein
VTAGAGAVMPPGRPRYLVAYGCWQGIVHAGRCVGCVVACTSRLLAEADPRSHARTAGGLCPAAAAAAAAAAGRLRGAPRFRDCRAIPTKTLVAGAWEGGSVTDTATRCEPLAAPALRHTQDEQQPPPPPPPRVSRCDLEGCRWASVSPALERELAARPWLAESGGGGCIPRVLHQTWRRHTYDGASADDRARDRRSWVDHNPDFTLRMWDDGESKRFRQLVVESPWSQFTSECQRC